MKTHQPRRGEMIEPFINENPTNHLCDDTRRLVPHVVRLRVQFARPFQDHRPTRPTFESSDITSAAHARPITAGHSPKHSSVVSGPEALTGG